MEGSIQNPPLTTSNFNPSQPDPGSRGMHQKAPGEPIVGRHSFSQPETTSRSLGSASITKENVTAHI